MSKAMKTEGPPFLWEKFPYDGVYMPPPGVTEWVFPSAFRVVTGEIEILQYKDEAENERSKALEEVKPRRGRPRYQPTWKDGQESRQEEALWPYAECVIAGRQIRSQNIGTVKAMARDKARNRKVKVPVVVHLPNGEDYTIVFHPDGHQTMSQTTEIQKGANHAERREPEKMPADSEQVRVPPPDADGNRRVQRVTESYLQDAAERDYSDAAKREFQRRNRGRRSNGDPGCHDGQPECGGD